MSNSNFCRWHLGFCNESYLPTQRGFDTFYGYYTGGVHHYLHMRTATQGGTYPPGYDFQNGNEVDLSAKGTYSSVCIFQITVKDCIFRAYFTVFVG